MDEKASPELIAKILNPSPVQTEPHTPYSVFILSLLIFPPLACYFIYKSPYYYKWAVYLLWLSAFSSLTGISLTGFSGLNCLLILLTIVQTILAVYLHRQIKISSPAVKKLLLITFIILALSFATTGYAISQTVTRLTDSLYNYSGYIN